MYTASERLYLTKDGKVLREHELDESTVATLLVGEGGQLDDARAKELGLTGKAKAKAEEVKAEPEAAPEVDDKAQPRVANKAVQPQSDKAAR